MATFTLPSRSRSPTDTTTTTTTTTTTDSDDDLDTLPYPQPLARTAFLSADFTPETYLTTLHNRHQTLEDLRTELRQRSQQINRELLDLVNSEYEDFLSLGADLKGGGERVEGVRVGCLGLGREVDGLRGLVGERAEVVGGLVGQRREVLGERVLGRGLLEVGERVEELEAELGIRVKEGLEEGEEDDDDGDEGPEEENNDGMSAVRTLDRQAEKLLLLTRLIARLGAEHPFLQAQRPRVEQIRKTLLLDMASALRSAKTSGSTAATMGLLNLYGKLGSEAESVRVLKGRG